MHYYFQIDPFALLKMDEKELSELFSKYGDRFAITYFCRKQLADPNKKKDGILTKLKMKLKKP